MTSPGDWTVVGIVAHDEAMMELRGRVALVTGAGHRVGRAIALALGARGMRLAVHYNAAELDARQTLDELTSLGTSGALFRADLTQPDAPADLVRDVVANLGGIDVVVNSAAVMRRTPFGSITPREWDDIIALNTRAPFFLAQAAAPHLRERNGVVINIADLAAFETWPGYLPHGISKSAVVHMTRSLAAVLAPEVRVAGIAPGTVLLPDNWNEEDADHLRRTTPLKRHGTPLDVAATVLFLIESDYITGETIIVDGGRHVRR
jgi:pteridine reductase